MSGTPPEPGPAQATAGPGADAEQAGLEGIFDQLQQLPAGELGAGRYRLYKTAEGGLHLVYRPDHLGTDQHLPLPPAIMTAVRLMSRGPIGALARRQARRHLEREAGPADGS